MPVDVLLACDEEGVDGTRLAHCVKVYLPPPDGKFGMVFRIERRDGKLRLTYAAFGVRHHPPTAGFRPSTPWTDGLRDNDRDQPR